MLFDAQNRIVWQLRQFRRVPVIRRRSPRQCSQHLREAVALDTSIRLAGKFFNDTRGLFRLLLHLRYCPIFYVVHGCCSVSPKFQDYPKLSQTYYVLLECLAQDHMSFLSTLEPQVFLYILSSISEGLTALGAQLNNYTGLCRIRDTQHT